MGLTWQEWAVGVAGLRCGCSIRDQDSGVKAAAGWRQKPAQWQAWAGRATLGKWGPVWDTYGTRPPMCRDRYRGPGCSGMGSNTS